MEIRYVYNAAVDATWGLSLHRLRDGSYHLWHVTFYGSFTGGASMGTPGYFPCLLAPHVGDVDVPMANATATRGWTLFPQNADQCVIDRGLTTEQILNEFFFTFDAGPDPWPTVTINGRHRLGARGFETDTHVGTDVDTAGGTDCTDCTRRHQHDPDRDHGGPRGQGHVCDDPDDFRG